MIILFASNTFTGDTYYFDNLDSYQALSGNTPPTVSITSPANGTSFSSGSTVSLSATAADTDGSVARVEFFANGNSIGIDTSSPYNASWVIGTGTYSLTAVATDNSGATTTSSIVSVTGQGGSASSMSVAGIVTGTASAPGGSKFGTATITVRDNLGNPVANASVTGTFSGSFSETKTGVTGANGSVTITTTAKLKGALTVNFCVTNVTHGSLTYNASQNTITCTGAGGRSTTRNGEGTDPSVNVTTFPNPFREEFELKVELQKTSEVAVTLYDITGKLIRETPPSQLNAGVHIIKFTDIQTKGMVLIKTSINNRNYYLRQMRGK